MDGQNVTTNPVQPLARQVEICNVKGLHARASAALAREALKYDAKVTLQHEEIVADAASIMDLLMLTAHKGCKVQISAKGPQADEALNAICDLIADKFGEGE